MGNTQKPPRLHQPSARISNKSGENILLRPPSNLATTFCKYCTLQFPQGAITDHQNMCHKNPLHIFMTCSTCSKKLNLIDYQQHLTACEAENIKTSAVNEEEVSTKINCEYCRKAVEIGVYMDHLRKCPRSPTNRHTPCSFCQETLPEDLIMKHAEFCAKNPENVRIICLECRKQFKTKQYEIHLKECQRIHSQQNPQQENNSIKHINTLYPKLSETAMKQSQSFLKQSVCLPENECPICLCEIKKSDDVRFLPCFHKYHNKCITDWCKKQSVCPICQIDIQ